MTQLPVQHPAHRARTDPDPDQIFQPVGYSQKELWSRSRSSAALMTCIRPTDSNRLDATARARAKILTITSIPTTPRTPQSAPVGSWKRLTSNHHEKRRLSEAGRKHKHSRWHTNHKSSLCLGGSEKRFRRYDTSAWKSSWW